MKRIRASAFHGFSDGFPLPILRDYCHRRPDYFLMPPTTAPHRHLGIKYPGIRFKQPRQARSTRPVTRKIVPLSFLTQFPAANQPSPARSTAENLKLPIFSQIILSISTIFQYFMAIMGGLSLTSLFFPHIVILYRCREIRPWPFANCICFAKARRVGSRIARWRIMVVQRALSPWRHRLR